VDDYFASEIEPNAIKVAQKNFPDTIQVGGVKEFCGSCVGQVDLLIGGSPCQDLSIAKKGRKGLEGDRSGLFWEYVRIWKEAKPTWFVLENVASMPKADRDIITREMGVEPILLDAALVSAQSRKRLFWTNIPNVTQPEDKGILLKDILQPDSEVDDSMTVHGKSFCLTATYAKLGESAGEVEHNRKRKQRTMVKQMGHIGETNSQTNRVYDPEGKAPTQCKGPNGGATPTLVRMGHLDDSPAQGNRVYSPEGKSVTLSANGGGRGAKTGLYYVGHLEGRVRKGMEGQEDLSRAHPQCDRVYGVDGKAPTLSASETSGRTHVAVVVSEPRIRKLTPVECERLQGLPDNYTEGIAKTNRYKCLGNAFNVDVVSHLLSFLPVDHTD
jgi:DNA (cytosine-5)-methyltransferase 3A